MVKTRRSTGYWSRLMMMMMALIFTMIIFVIDLKVRSSVAIGAIYTIVILYSWVIKGKRSSILMAILCSVLVLYVAIFHRASGKMESAEGLNTLISLVVIWVCTALVTLAKRSFESLDRANENLEVRIEHRTEELNKKIRELDFQKDKYHESELRFKVLLESAPDAMVIVDDKGVIQITNTQTENLFGYKTEEMLNRKVEMLIPERYHQMHPDHRTGYFQKPKVRPMGAELDLWGVKKGGEEFPLEISLSPIHTDNGLLVTAAIRDISQRKAYEKQLNAYNQQLISKNKVLEQFVYIASHDLQEPLRTVSSFTELISKRYSEKFDETGHKSMRFIIEATHRMSNLIKGLLDYSRLGKNKALEEVDVGALLDTLKSDMSSLIEDTNATIRHGAMPVLQAYETEMRMLFQNLITNAIKFRQKDVPPMIEVTAKKKKNHWQFNITDNGIGIEKKNQEKIFEIFQRLHDKDKYEGTGIGLAHCQKIVALHGGKLWVRSDEDSGSTFSFTIPT